MLLAEGKYHEFHGLSFGFANRSSNAILAKSSAVLIPHPTFNAFAKLVQAHIGCHSLIK
jgi:hypothetical protein